MQAIELRPEIDDFTETLVRLYLAQDTGMLLGLVARHDAEARQRSDMGSFKSLLIDTRNKRMAERAAPFIEAGNAFIAVGALHLPGKTAWCNCCAIADTR